MSTLALQKLNYAKSIRSYTVLIIVTLLLGGYYGVTQYLKFSGAQTALINEQKQIIDLQTIQSQTSGTYTSVKNGFNQRFRDVLDSLETIYPYEEKYTDLSRLFDQFFKDTNTSSNPFFISDLKFGQARYDASKGYAVLPVSMTISASKTNFMKFMKYVETSGVLDTDKTKLVRLMDVRSISINFDENAANSTTTGGQPAEANINVSVSLNAYFQKPYTKAAQNGVAAGN